jgi:hypothetical protein
VFRRPRHQNFIFSISTFKNQLTGAFRLEENDADTDEHLSSGNYEVGDKEVKKGSRESMFSEAVYHKNTSIRILHYCPSLSLQ